MWLFRQVRWRDGPGRLYDTIIPNEGLCLTIGMSSTLLVLALELHICVSLDWKLFECTSAAFCLTGG